MTIYEKENYNLLVILQVKFEELTKELHLKMFPEEYNFILDSAVDISLRKKGINPMSENYQNEVNERRKKLGFSNFESSIYGETLKYCQNLIINKEK